MKILPIAEKSQNLWSHIQSKCIPTHNVLTTYVSQTLISFFKVLQATVTLNENAATLVLE